MGVRKKVNIPKRFVERYGEKIPLWSYSKVSTYGNCKWEYYLSRVKKIQGDDNIYTLAGSAAHDIIEDFYNKKIKYEEMKDKFESNFLNIEISDYKFAKEEDSNERMSKKYKECVSNFFETHSPIETKVLIERLIWIDVNGNLFMGYVDAITKDKDGNYHVIDWKTSTIYKGKKIKEQSKQLMLYALGLHQTGVPLDKIKVSWNFLKYVNISYMQKNGKLKVTSAERNKWVKAIKTPLKRDIKSFYELEDWQVDLKVDDCIIKNNLDDLDDSIKNKYSLSDCYVYADVNEDTIEELKNGLTSAIDEINQKGKDEANWYREDIQPSEEYYCNVLCGLRSKCRYYKEMLNKKNIKQEQEELDILDFLEEEFMLD